MAFTSYAFVLFLVGIVFPLRWLLPARYAPTVLLVASVVFYLTWGWKVAALLAVMTLFTYGAGRVLERRKEGKKPVLIGTVAVLLAVLATFKYAGFIVSFIPGMKAPDLPLPLGISFYVFEMISYVVDIYRGDPAARSLPEFALYVSYFPHLIAGPIVRASELLPQLHRDVKFDGKRVSHGVFVMLTGFVKKMVLADNLGGFADLVFKSPKDFTGFEVGIAILAYTGQIFCDFSGYTDIARGASEMLGYELPENFRYPYLSASITEFWRRWHMTLSRWLRDYLYISLGGNRGSELATYRNLLLTMTLGGLWHGARMTFVIWGVYHGILLALHKLILGATKGEAWKKLRAHDAYRAASVAGTLTLVMIGWVFFRAASFADALTVFSRLAHPLPPHSYVRSRQMDLTLWFLAGVVLLHVAGASKLGERTHDGMPPAARGVMWTAMIAVLYLLATASPTFIYFYF